MKITRKAMTILIEAIICLLLFTACGAKQESENGKAEEKNADKLKVYVLKYDGNKFVEAIEKYNQLQDDETYQIECEEIEIEQLYDTSVEMLDEMREGNGPDIIYYERGNRFDLQKAIDEGLIADLNSLIEKDEEWDASFENKMNPIVLQAGARNGKQYLMPLSYGVPFVCTTPEICADYGVDSNELFLSIEDMKKYPQVDGRAVLSGLDQYESSFYYEFFPEDSATYNYKDEEFQTLVEDVTSLEDEATDRTNLIFYMKESERLCNGEIGFMKIETGEQATNMCTAYELTKSTFDKELALFGLKDLEGNIVGKVEDGIAINQNSDKKEQAFAFLKYMLTEDVQKTINGSKTVDGISIRTDCMQEDMNIFKQRTNDTYSKRYEEIINQMNYCICENDYYTNTVFIPNLSEYKLGKITMDELVEKLEN